MLNQIPPGLRNLLILIGLGFLAQYALPNVKIDASILYAYYPDSPNFKPWQIITHMFCHGGWSHLLFNGIALFSFGTVLELRLGTKKFLSLFFISGLGAILIHYISVAVMVYMTTGTIMPYHDGLITGANQYTPALGASGALYGILIGFVFFYPNERLVFLFIPYPVKAKILIPILLAIDVIGGFGQFSWDPIAHFAHVGGALTGYLVLRFWAWKKIKNNWQ
jgi:membrane associated rhomboid family serine protease